MHVGSALAGSYIRSRLPPTHLSKESQDVVRLGMGLVATMTALLLGLVTAAARSTFDTQDVALRNSAAAILTLDRHLARYGPETKRTRELIRSAVAFRLDTTWGALAVLVQASAFLERLRRSRKSRTRFFNSHPRPMPNAGPKPKR